MNEDVKCGVKYYYIKLKDNFFESDEIKILESLKDGKIYSLIYLKLLLKNLKHNGCLIFNGYIPYSAEMLSTILNENVGVIKEAMLKFEGLGLITKKTNGEIWIDNIQEFIGRSTTEGERKKIYRQNLKLKEQASLINKSEIITIEKNELKIEKPEKKVEKNSTIDLINKILIDKNVDIFNENEKNAIEKWMDFRTKNYKTKKTEQAIKVQINNFIKIKEELNKDYEICDIIQHICENTTWQNITIEYLKSAKLM